MSFTEAAPNIIIDEVGGLYLKESDITVSGGTLKPGSLRLLDNETKLEIVVAVKPKSMDNLKIAIGRNTELNIKGEIVSAIIPVDTVRPTVVNIVSDLVPSKEITGIINITVTFSEEVQVTLESNISVTGGVRLKGNDSSGDPYVRDE